MTRESAKQAALRQVADWHFRNRFKALAGGGVNMYDLNRELSVGLPDHQWEYRASAKVAWLQTLGYALCFTFTGIGFHAANLDKHGMELITSVPWETWSAVFGLTLFAALKSFKVLPRGNSRVLVEQSTPRPEWMRRL